MGVFINKEVLHEEFSLQYIKDYIHTKLKGYVVGDIDSIANRVANMKTDSEKRMVIDMIEEKIHHIENKDVGNNPKKKREKELQLEVLRKLHSEASRFNVVSYNKNHKDDDKKEDEKDKKDNDSGRVHGSSSNMFSVD